ncbi:MAG: hypothetical protein WBA82_00475 [Castellaniella sp.]|uniref:hypothetical protein n=1 Tax=Castellaniella sp. TaxID=1955812 RepID=UPI003C765D2D
MADAYFHDKIMGHWKHLNIVCGSLPADDVLIASRLGMDAEAFQNDKAILLRPCGVRGVRDKPGRAEGW